MRGLDPRTLRGQALGAFRSHLQALDASVPQALPALQRAACVRTSETSDFEGAAEREFDHHLLYQVTHDTLLKAEQRLGQGAAALAIDSFEQAGAEAQRRFANTVAMAWVRRAMAWLHMARQDYPGGSRHIEIGLPWAGRIESETLRAESEAQLLTLSGMVSMLVSRLDEARGTLKAVERGGDLWSTHMRTGPRHRLTEGRR